MNRLTIIKEEYIHSKDNKLAKYKNHLHAVFNAITLKQRQHVHVRKTKQKCQGRKMTSKKCVSHDGHLSIPKQNS